MMQITYQKQDGSIIKRYRNSILPYQIGEITSMGWKVLNIEYEYKGNYYPQYKYLQIIDQCKKKYIKKNQIKEFYKIQLKIFEHCIILLLFLKTILINFLH